MEVELLQEECAIVLSLKKELGGGGRTMHLFDIYQLNGTGFIETNQ